MSCAVLEASSSDQRELSEGESSRQYLELDILCQLGDVGTGFIKDQSVEIYTQIVLAVSYAILHECLGARRSRPSGPILEHLGRLLGCLFLADTQITCCQLLQRKDRRYLA
jgi:hypothetical protein